MDVLRAGERFETAQPGIVSRHCFSAGAHYDPARLGLGTLVGVDEHHVEPGAGFGWHAHRGVDILTWVLDGTLRHDDAMGSVRLVRPGQLVAQITGSGIRHRETNASTSEPLRFVQTTLLGPTGEPDYRQGGSSIVLSGGTFAVLRVDGELDPPAADPAHVFVTRGPLALGGHTLCSGDSARLSGERVRASGSGELLVWSART